MFGKTALFAFALALTLPVSPTASVKSFAQDAGVSGIPHGPGSAGGLNNSVRDPSGIGNAARLPAPPPPNIAVPAVPTAAPPVSARNSPVVTRRVKTNRRAAPPSRRELRRSSARSPARARSKPIDGKFSICRGC